MIEQAQIDTSIEPEQVAFCDAHDLIAIISAGSNSESAVTVHRLKGEVAFTVALRDDEDLRPSSLRWRPDGSLLAVHWSDDVCCLYSGENGKLLYELPTRHRMTGDDGGWTLDVNAQDVSSAGFEEDEPSPQSGSRPAPIIWTSYNDYEKKSNGSHKDHDDVTTEDFFDMMNGDQENGIKSPPQRSDSAILDLVNAITTMDTTTVLPRLGKIDTPSGMRFSPEGNKFSTQASTDTIFDASTFAPGIFSTLLTSHANGCVTVFVDETIEVGHIQLSSSEQVRSASSAACPSQVILARDADSQDQYSLNFIDLPLDRLGSPLNYVVSLNTRRLQSLTSYITHTIRCIHQEIQTGIKGVPARLMKLLEEDLRSASGSESTTTDTATIELQHLALTSNFHPVLLEWLKDIVKETGHKRWDQATSAMYERVQGYLFKNVLPALQRFVIAASALRGQAEYHRHTGTFDVGLEVLDGLIEWADTLNLVAQRTLMVVTEELGQFRAFSKWLRVMIDVAVAGPGSKSADETEERESPNFDVDPVLRYIRGPLMGSLLKVLAEASPPGGMGAVSREEFFGHSTVQAMSRDRTVACLKQLDNPGERNRLQPRTKGDAGDALHTSDPVNLPLLTCLLKAHTRVAIDEINAWQSQAVPRSPDTVSLEALVSGTETEELGTVYDMAVHSSSNSANGKGTETVHVLAGPPSSPQGGLEARLLSVRRHRTTTNIAPRIEIATIPIPSTLQSTSSSAGKVLHAAFLPNPSSPFPTPPKPQTLILAHADGAAHTTVLFLHTDHGTRILHAWPPPTTTAAETFLPSPTHFVVGGRPGKRVVVVFSPLGAPGGRGKGRGTRWEVLDLEGMEKRAEGGMGAEAEEEGEDDVEMR